MARKAEEQDQKEQREGTSVRRRADGTPASSASMPKVEGTPEQLGEMLRRAEEQQEGKEEKRDDEPKDSVE